MAIKPAPAHARDPCCSPHQHTLTFPHHTRRAPSEFSHTHDSVREIQTRNSREREEEEEGGVLEVEEKLTPHPLARLWHQEGAQQPLKTEPPPEQKVDTAVALVQRTPPLEGKRDADDRLLHLRTSTTTPSLQSIATVSFEFSPRRRTVATPLFQSRGDEDSQPSD